MFKFRFVLDYFRISDALGPIIENSLRAKWLTRFCPNDIELAFAPNEGQIPLYDPETIRIVSKTEPNWWNHYSFNSFQKDPNETNFSLGPNLYLDRHPEASIPLVLYSQWHKSMVLNKWIGYPEQYIKVIPNMIDHSLFKVGEKSKNITVGWIGREQPDPSTKGMEVIPYLAKRFPDIQFVMVHGNKPKFQHLWLNESLPNLKMYYQVPHHELAQLMRSWHVLICASKWETGATHVKEAMASGVPVIAPKMAVLPEVASSQILLDDLKWEVSDKESKVLLWTEESKERFALALEKLLGNKNRYQKYVKDALQESEKSSPENVAKLWFEFMYMCRDLKESE